ncbi:exodeoxyribonuclease [Gluconacetobacter sacchari DSM 12717]|uniref:DNA polymerase III subunit epsilon n=2 Tax=Gluconacetobacter sacchari TaxID=92759 RepID=A0A7W4ICJ2_9PROT|nr:DNA polymerase III subunit epsilon [Gluconacetobacter sacchari]MBB2160381.1 DNA polymerase III subunit epsilon [Gluconacetobacter sacchari]GBQ30481.1 exodeoxyribonuclease [Gluconacetobacter sacchari DSM 12717]
MDGTTPYVRVIDLETSDRDARQGGIVEIGWQDVTRAPDGWHVMPGPHARLTHPGGPIARWTTAIHHITDQDVRDAPPIAAIAPAILRPPARPLAFAAHRASFEQDWLRAHLPPPLLAGMGWICTYKCALRLWPDEPGHSNQGLRHSRKPRGLDRHLGDPAHRAGPDAYVTAHHLRDMLALASVERLLQWSRQPALLARVPHGPLRGRRIHTLATSDLDRLLATPRPPGPDLAFTIRTERARRAGQDTPHRPSAGQLALPL